VEKAVCALEKAAAGRRRDGDAGRQAATLRSGGDAGLQTQGHCGER
jgi:hypothetical protein